MVKNVNRAETRKTRQKRVRAKVKGTALRPRLCVYRSLNNIYANLINDETATTILSASTLDKEVKTKASNVEAVLWVLCPNFDIFNFLYVASINNIKIEIPYNTRSNSGKLFNGMSKTLRIFITG